MLLFRDVRVACAQFFFSLIAGTAASAYSSKVFLRTIGRDRKDTSPTSVGYFCNKLTWLAARLCLRDENGAIEMEVSHKQYDAVRNLEVRILDIV